MMQTHMHVIPGMDAAAAIELATLTLGETASGPQNGMDGILDAGGRE